MKVSKRWLQEILQDALQLPETTVLTEQLTMAGLEVDAVENAAEEFSGVVVGEIVGIEQHPDADKLRVCQVQGSAAEPIQVVCGAANAAQGLKIPFAEVGAVLPGNFKIKKAKLRGVESFGMLCAAQELGLEESSDGLLALPSDAPVGVSINEYLQLDDEIIEVDLTPNRGDCLGMYGVARETAVLNKAQFSLPKQTAIAASISEQKNIQLQNAQACPRYVSRIIKNIDNTKSSPVWMQEKLRRAGVRSIDAVVDITNYVLLELGQPMHAFDLAKIQGDIIVRDAQQNETLELLDGQTIELKNNELVIADEQQALALAGIMGGQYSAVQTDTQHILLEAAFFAPVDIAGRARSLGLHTDSSHRFERGVDFELPAHAMERATQLILDIVGGDAAEMVVAQAPEQIPQAKTVALNAGNIKSVLGLSLQAQQIEDILSGLGFTLTQTGEGAWSVGVPSWRFDVSIEADLLEEIARIYGYSELPVRALPIFADLQVLNEELREPASLNQVLLQRGYQEVISYSFVSELVQQKLAPNVQPIAVKNPISADMSVMRTTLWSGLLQTLDYNLKRQHSRLKIFEQGLNFVPSENRSKGENKYQQRKKIAGAIVGARLNENWTNSKEVFDFYDIKADVEALLGKQAIYFERTEHSALHPGQCAKVCTQEGQELGVLGALHPQLQKEWGFAQQVYLFELDYALIQGAELPEFSPVSKFPEVRRDIALLVDKEVTAQEILALIRKYSGDFLKDLILFDNYEGKGIDSSKKSIAIGLIYQRLDTTLVEEEINTSLQKVTQYLCDKFNASLRE